MIEFVEAREHQPLDDHAGCAYGKRRDGKRPPVIEPELVEQEPRAEGAHHVLGAVREVDDVQQSEDHRQAEREQRIERAVDEADQQLPEQGLGRNAEDFAHAPAIPSFRTMDPESRLPWTPAYAGVTMRVLMVT